MLQAVECPYCHEMTEAIPGYRGRCAVCLARYRIKYRMDDGCYMIQWWTWPITWTYKLREQIRTGAL